MAMTPAAGRCWQTSARSWTKSRRKTSTLRLWRMSSLHRQDHDNYFDWPSSVNVCGCNILYFLTSYLVIGKCNVSGANDRDVWLPQIHIHIDVGWYLIGYVSYLPWNDYIQYKLYHPPDPDTPGLSYKVHRGWVPKPNQKFGMFYKKGDLKWRVRPPKSHSGIIIFWKTTVCAD